MALATSKRYTIKSFEVDINNRAKLSTVINLMQETAWINAAKLGGSVNDLKKLGVTWVMTRMKLEMIRFPIHQDEVWIETWPSGSERAFVYRDYRIYDANKELIGQATSTWIVFDIETRKMTKVNDFLRPLTEPPTGFKHLPRATGKFRLNEAIGQPNLIKVRWHDLDPNHHVNNAYYFEWILEGLPLEKLNKDDSLIEIDLAIRSECQAEDELEVVIGKKTPGEYIHTIRRILDGKEIAQAKTLWKKTISMQ